MKIERPSWIPRWLSLPLVVFVTFIVLLFFVGENNFFANLRLEKENNRLKQQVDSTNTEASRFRTMEQQLHTDRETLERIARERMRWKAENEDVYIMPMP